MSYFITPKHSGSIENFLYPLLALRDYGQDQWATTEEFKDSLFDLYVQNHIDSEWVLDTNGNKVMKKDSSDYTKDLQLPAYFGFAEADSFQRNSNKRITKLGEWLLDEYELAGSTFDCDAVKDIFLEAMETVSFGRNNYGVINSDSDLEAPALFLKSAILLDGLSTKEFAYIIEQLDTNNKDFSQVIIDVKRRRRLNLSLDSSISTDIKFITLFKNLGILVNGPERNLNYVCPFYLDQRYDRVSALPIDNKDKEHDSDNDNNETNTSDMTKSIQRIYYGAPGTGKSNEIKRMTGDGTFSKDFTFRTTFHPDSDYSSFVGAYKPIWNGTKIIYDFRPQTFLKAYIAAWTNPHENVALVIEEINRGNCAQIFGDIFQLLDRESNGLSKYPIETDVDLENYLKNIFSGNVDGFNPIGEVDKDAINNYYSKHYDNAFDKIKEGKILTLPLNLSILCTMNTSDQSLFPMDSAFKRRWSWEYMPIKDAHKEWKIQLDKSHELIDWWEFLKRINVVVSDLTTSEDKQLGYFFCQPDEFVEDMSDSMKLMADPNMITAKQFVDKVIFYLWNDVFKDYAFDAPCCKGKDDKEVLFAKFYNEDGKSVNIDTLTNFFESLKTDDEDSLVKTKKSNADETDKKEENNSINTGENQPDNTLSPEE